MTNECNTYKYYLKKDKKIVYCGPTYDLNYREAQHQKEFPGSRIYQVGRKTTREQTLEWERKTKRIM